jgi:hypothetical protein
MRKHPGLVVLLGHLHSCDFVPKSTFCPTAELEAGLRLQLDHSPAFSDHATLLVHGNAETYARSGIGLRRAPRLTGRAREIPWLDSSCENGSIHLYSRLLKPFAHLICIFIASVEPPWRIADRLRAWCIDSRDSQSPRPRKLVINACGEARTAIEIEQALIGIAES